MTHYKCISITASKEAYLKIVLIEANVKFWTPQLQFM